MKRTISDPEKDYESENERVEIEITRKDVKKTLVYAIIVVIMTFFLCVLAIIVTQRYIKWFGGAIIVGIYGVLIVRLYILNPEAFYGIMIGRKKLRNIANPEVHYGHRLGIWFIVFFFILFFIVLDILDAVILYYFV